MVASADSAQWGSSEAQGAPALSAASLGGHARAKEPRHHEPITRTDPGARAQVHPLGARPGARTKRRPTLAETTSPIFVEDTESGHVLHLARSAPPFSLGDLVQAFAEASSAKVRADLAAGGGEIDEVLWECWADIPPSALRPGADGSAPEGVSLHSSTYRQDDRLVTRAGLEPYGAEPAVVSAPLTPDQVVAARGIERQVHADDEMRFFLGW